MALTVQVVEDDAAIRLVLRTILDDEGYTVVESDSAEQALVQFAQAVPDVLLVDLRLPGMHGLDLVRHVRGQVAVPILIVSAHTDSHDVVAGLEAGADDYVTKPFVAKELTSRIRAVLRRTTRTDQDDDRLVCGPIEIRQRTAEVLRDGAPLTLSRIEFEVLSELVAARGAVLSREYLLRTVWGYPESSDGRVVDNLVYRLRTKIGDDAEHPLIRTVRGFGYRMTPP